MHTKQIDLSILIVTYNSAREIGACLESIATQTRGVRYEVLVADNASGDGTAALIRKRYPWVKVEELGSNRGFAAANNALLAKSRGGFVALLNPDTTLEGDAFTKMVEYMRGAPDVGVAGPRILDGDGRLQGSARAFPTVSTAFFGRSSALTRLWPNNPISRANVTCIGRENGGPLETDWVSGACLVARREAVDKAGPLDEKFFMYWEDADWCRRIRDRGLRVFWLPDACVRHLIGCSSDSNYVRCTVEFHRSVYYYWRKHTIKSALSPMNVIAWLGLGARMTLKLLLYALRGGPLRNKRR